MTTIPKGEWSALGDPFYRHAALRAAQSTGIYKLLRGRFWHFPPQGRHVAPMGVKFGTDQWTEGTKFGKLVIYGYENNGISFVQCRLGWGLPLHQVASWSIQPFCRNRHGPIIGAAMPLFGERAGSQSNTTCLGWGLYIRTKWHLLIHPAIWPQ